MSFPSNPTAQVVSLEFYEEVVKIALKYNVYILSDLAYAEYIMITYHHLQSFKYQEQKKWQLNLPQCLRLIQWQDGELVLLLVIKHLINALTRIKSYLDYGAFTPVQVAAAAALNGPQDCVQEIRNIYQKRRDVLINSMASRWMEGPTPSPKASMFAWAPIPR